MSDTMIVRRTRRHGGLREQVMRQYSGVCHLCKEPFADAIDHIVPVAHGGSDHRSNLKPAHTSCNSRKRDAKPEAWTYKHPDMWLEGYGPKDRQRAAKRATVRQDREILNRIREEQQRQGHSPEWLEAERVRLSNLAPVPTPKRKFRLRAWEWVAFATFGITSTAAITGSLLVLA